MGKFKTAIKRPLLRVAAALGRRIGRVFDARPNSNSWGRALIIQLGGVGDVLRVFPLIERLQAACPEGEVLLLTNQNAGLLELYPGSRLPRHELFDLRWSYWRKLRAVVRLRSSGIDLVVNPTRGDGMLECAVMAWIIGAPNRIGFDRDGVGFPHTFKQPFSDTESILEQNLGLLAPLNIEPGEARLRLRIPESAASFAAAWYGRHAPDRAARIVIHPWATSHAEFRAWPISQYAALIRELLSASDAIVVVLGSESEAGKDRGWLAGLPPSRVMDLAGTTRLDQAAALISGCDVFVGNDSGLIHFALSAGVPVVGVFGATPAAQVLHTSREAVAVTAGVPCQPCYRHQPLFDYRCDYQFRCLRQLTVTAVLTEVLRRTPPRRRMPAPAATPGPM